MVPNARLNLGLGDLGCRTVCFDPQTVTVGIRAGLTDDGDIRNGPRSGVQGGWIRVMTKGWKNPNNLW